VQKKYCVKLNVAVRLFCLRLLLTLKVISTVISVDIYLFDVPFECILTHLV